MDIKVNQVTIESIDKVLHTDLVSQRENTINNINQKKSPQVKSLYESGKENINSDQDDLHNQVINNMQPFCQTPGNNANQRIQLQKMLVNSQVSNRLSNIDQDQYQYQYSNHSNHPSLSSNEPYISIGTNINYRPQLSSEHNLKICNQTCQNIKENSNFYNSYEQQQQMSTYEERKNYMVGSHKSQRKPYNSLDSINRTNINYQSNNSSMPPIPKFKLIQKEFKKSSSELSQIQPLSIVNDINNNINNKNETNNYISKPPINNNQIIGSNSFSSTYSSNNSMTQNQYKLNKITKLSQPNSFRTEADSILQFTAAEYEKQENSNELQKNGCKQITPNTLEIQQKEINLSQVLQNPQIECSISNEQENQQQYKQLKSLVHEQDESLLKTLNINKQFNLKQTNNNVYYCQQLYQDQSQKCKGSQQQNTIKQQSLICEEELTERQDNYSYRTPNKNMQNSSINNQSQLKSNNQTKMYLEQQKQSINSSNNKKNIQQTQLENNNCINPSSLESTYTKLLKKMIIPDQRVNNVKTSPKIQQQVQTVKKQANSIKNPNNSLNNYIINSAKQQMKIQQNVSNNQAKQIIYHNNNSNKIIQQNNNQKNFILHNQKNKENIDYRSYEIPQQHPYKIISIQQRNDNIKTNYTEGESKIKQGQIVDSQNLTNNCSFKQNTDQQGDFCKHSNTTKIEQYFQNGIKWDQQCSELSKKDVNHIEISLPSLLAQANISTEDLYISSFQLQQLLEQEQFQKQQQQQLHKSSQQRVNSVENNILDQQLINTNKESIQLRQSNIQDSLDKQLSQRQINSGNQSPLKILKDSIDMLTNNNLTKKQIDSNKINFDQDLCKIDLEKFQIQYQDRNYENQEYKTYKNNYVNQDQQLLNVNQNNQKYQDNQRYSKQNLMEEIKDEAASSKNVINEDNVNNEIQYNKQQKEIENARNTFLNKCTDLIDITSTSSKSESQLFNHTKEMLLNKVQQNPQTAMFFKTKEQQFDFSNQDKEIQQKQQQSQLNNINMIPSIDVQEKIFQQSQPNNTQLNFSQEDRENQKEQLIKNQQGKLVNNDFCIQTGESQESIQQMNNQGTETTRRDNKCLEEILTQFNYLKSRTKNINPVISQDIQNLEQQFTQIYDKYKSERKYSTQRNNISVQKLQNQFMSQQQLQNSNRDDESVLLTYSKQNEVTNSIEQQNSPTLDQNCIDQQHVSQDDNMNENKQHSKIYIKEVYECPFSPFSQTIKEEVNNTQLYANYNNSYLSNNNDQTSLRLSNSNLKSQQKLEDEKQQLVNEISDISKLTLIEDKVFPVLQSNQEEQIDLQSQEDNKMISSPKEITLNDQPQQHLQLQIKNAYIDNNGLGMTPKVNRQQMSPNQKEKNLEYYKIMCILDQECPLSNNKTPTSKGSFKGEKKNGNLENSCSQKKINNFNNNTYEKNTLNNNDNPKSINNSVMKEINNFANQQQPINQRPIAIEQQKFIQQFLTNKDYQSSYSPLCRQQQSRQDSQTYIYNCNNIINSNKKSVRSINQSVHNSSQNSTPLNNNQNLQKIIGNCSSKQQNNSMQNFFQDQEEDNYFEFFGAATSSEEDNLEQMLLLNTLKKQFHQELEEKMQDKQNMQLQSKKKPLSFSNYFSTSNQKSQLDEFQVNNNNSSQDTKTLASSTKSNGFSQYKDKCLNISNQGNNNKKKKKPNDENSFHYHSQLEKQVKDIPNNQLKKRLSSSNRKHKLTEMVEFLGQQYKLNVNLQDLIKNQFI